MGYGWGPFSAPAYGAAKGRCGACGAIFRVSAPQATPPAAVSRDPGALVGACGDAEEPVQGLSRSAAAGPGPVDDIVELLAGDAGGVRDLFDGDRRRPQVVRLEDQLVAGGSRVGDLVGLVAQFAEDFIGADRVHGVVLCRAG